MSILNARIRGVSDSPTLKIAEKASALKNQGHPVLNLSLGEPDTQVPEWVQQAAIDAIARGDHLYTATSGLKPLKQAIIQKMERENRLYGFSEANVVVSTGAKQVLFNALSVSLEPGDEVIIPAPYWVSYTAMTELADGVPVIVSCGADTGFKMTPEALQAALTPRSKWVILNSPNNPSGAVYTRKELEALAQVLEAYPHVWILSDEIYEHLVYGNAEAISILEVAPSLMSRTLLVNGVSKSFAMTGWRLGYGVGPTPLLEGMIRLQSQSTSGACCITQSAALAALSDGRSSAFLNKQKQVFVARRDVLVEGLSTVEGLTLFSPDGAFYGFAQCAGLLAGRTPGGRKVGSDAELAEAMLEEIFLSCVPGSEFGMPGYLRFSYAVEEAILREAIERLRIWVQDFTLG